MNTLRVWIGMSTLVGLLALGGCNTMAGLGQDIEQGGEALEQEAKEAK